MQSCSMAAQGLWINVMCLAHECEPYGHLTINGKAMTPAQLGRQVGLTARECEALLDELTDSGVARRTDEGVIFSSRMVRDEDLRNRRAAGGKDGAEHGSKGAEAGSKGGRPKTVEGGGKGGFETPLPGLEKPPPSSSSSSSTSVSTPDGVEAPRKRSAASPGEHGTRLPVDWVLPDDWRQWCRRERPDLDPDAVAEQFRDFWVAKPGKDGRKADWQATWRNWCRGQKAGSGRRGGDAGDWTGRAV